MKVLAWIRKAITAAIVAGGSAAVTALQDGHLSDDDWALIVGAAVVGGVAVFLVPNRPSPR